MDCRVEPGNDDGCGELGRHPLPPNSGLPEFGTLSRPKSDKSDFGWGEGWGEGLKSLDRSGPPSPQPSPLLGEGAHRVCSAMSGPSTVHPFPWRSFL
jgi:hypothetical protein